MTMKKNIKPSETLVEELRKRSRKGLELAKKIMLAEKIEHKKMRDALEHYTSSWDDFTHAGMLSIACEAVGGNTHKATKVQAAIAMVAAAFDIHDDIIDRSRTKHGVPTVFGKFGKDVALLLGNAFVLRGFTFLGESTSELPRERAKEIFATLNRTLSDVGNAHALELNLRGRTNDVSERYLHVVKMKAASIEADMRIGALVGGGTTGEVEALTKYGRIMGTLATLREEFIDIFEIEELRQRIRGQYLPVPILYAMQDAKSYAVIQKLLASGKLRKDDINELVDAVFDAKSVKKLRKTMENLISESVQLVEKARNDEPKSLLVSLTSSALEDL